MFKFQWSRPLLLTFTVSAALFGQPALAHVIWFDYDYDNEAYNLIFGHPEEDEPETLEPAKFQEATAYSAERSVIELNPIETEAGLSFVAEEEVAALTAFYDNGFWREYPDGSSENISLAEAEAVGYADVTSFLKYTKGIYEWSNAIDQPFGLPLEIMPLENPLAVMPGEDLPIQVLYEGEIVDTALVEYLGEELSVAEDGTVLVPVGAGGLDVIEASYPSPSATNPEISYATTLSAEAVSESTSVPEPSAWLGLSLFGLMALTKPMRVKLKLSSFLKASKNQQ